MHVTAGPLLPSNRCSQDPELYSIQIHLQMLQRIQERRRNPIWSHLRAGPFCFRQMILVQTEGHRSFFQGQFWDPFPYCEALYGGVRRQNPARSKVSPKLAGIDHVRKGRFALPKDNMHGHLQVMASVPFPTTMKVKVISLDA